MDLAKMGLLPPPDAVEWQVSLAELYERADAVAKQAQERVGTVFTLERRCLGYLKGGHLQGKTAFEVRQAHAEHFAALESHQRRYRQLADEFDRLMGCIRVRTRNLS